MNAERPILEVEGLTVAYDTPYGQIRAVDGVSFLLDRREVLGLVGESGSGKSSLGLAVVRHLPDSGHIAGGALRFFGTDLAQLEGSALRHARGQRIAMVYQDPAGALNPSMRIGKQIEEVFAVRGERDRDAMRRRTLDILGAVQIADPGEAYDRYPHQFSGGQQQRIVIAMALAMEPDLLILDEPTTGLDVSVEAGILELFRDLRERISAGILFISHNISIISQICDRVGVMHRGRLIEMGPAGDVLNQPTHEYTRSLLSSRIPLGAVRPRRERPPPRILLDARSLGKSYHSGGRRVDAIRDVSLALPARSVLGIVGESGSGKTTTARVVAGLITADRGDLRFEAEELAPSVEARRDEQRRA
ncbi:MAG: ATP-binding cassette domain-containing protein, partial [Aestuariivirga sp.]|uniref:ATP-binding cassette domain-containing protein n=1 Tax=Aestuariivirga sp. TaxID=2650926 RepID=UPI0030166472